MRRPGPSPKAIQRLRANGPALPASSLVPESPLKVGCAIGDALAGLPPELLIELVARAGAHALEVAGREELLKLVEHEVVGRRLRIPEVRERHVRSEEHTSELQSLMRISYAVFCLKKKKTETL